MSIYYIGKIIFITIEAEKYYSSPEFIKQQEEFPVMVIYDRDYSISLLLQLLIIFIFSLLFFFKFKKSNKANYIIIFLSLFFMYAIYVTVAMNI